MTGVLDRHRCTEGETGLWVAEWKLCAWVHVRECVCDRERVWDTVLTPHLLYVCVLTVAELCVLIKRKLRRDEALQCALVWLSIRWRRRLVHVFLKWGCSDTRISNDWRGTEGKRVSVIEMEGFERMTTWKSDMGGGGVLRVQPALHAGQVMQHSTPRGYIFLLWPTLTNAHLCVHCVCTSSSIAIIPSSRSTHGCTSYTPCLQFTSYLFQQHIKHHSYLNRYWSPSRSFLLLHHLYPSDLVW